MKTKDLLIQELLQLNIFELNDYFYKYVNLILNNINTKKVKYETEKHHIIPRSYYISRNLKVINKDNIVNLKYSDHILAHYYLCFCLIEDEDIDRSMFAFITMIKTNKNKYLDSLQLSEEKILEIRENYFRNHIVKDITKTKISESNKKNHKGARWMNNGLHDSFVLKDYIEDYLQKGWKFGRLYKVSNNTKSKISSTLTGRTHSTSQETKDKISAANKGKIYINKEGIVKIIHKQELNNYLQQGWNRGNPNAKGNLGNKGTYRYITNGTKNIQYLLMI